VVSRFVGISCLVLVLLTVFGTVSKYGPIGFLSGSISYKKMPGRDFIQAFCYSVKWLGLRLLLGSQCVEQEEQLIKLLVLSIKAIADILF
jgi:hypothetical protein